jgi:competence protein ComEA
MRKEWYLITGLVVYFLFIRDTPEAPVQVDVQTNWVVEVKGEVRSPGVFSVSPGMRVFEAVVLAGGLTDAADVRTISMSTLLEDAMVIHIRPYETIASTLININTASVSELMMLPGFGVSRSQDVIDHRTQNGPFRRIEDIVNVKGIGQATFEQIKELIFAG